MYYLQLPAALDSTINLSSGPPNLPGLPWVWPSNLYLYLLYIRLNAKTTKKEKNFLSGNSPVTTKCGNKIHFSSPTELNILAFSWKDFIFNFLLPLLEFLHRKYLCNIFWINIFIDVQKFIFLNTGRCASGRFSAGRCASGSFTTGFVLLVVFLQVIVLLVVFSMSLCFCSFYYRSLCFWSL